MKTIKHVVETRRKWNFTLLAMLQPSTLGANSTFPFTRCESYVAIMDSYPKESVA